MLFLTRSALCIGIVVYMLPGAGGPAGLRDVAASAGTAAVGQARSYCETSGRCMQVGAGVAESLVGRSLAAALIHPHPTSEPRLTAATTHPKSPSRHHDAETGSLADRVAPRPE